jgi:hypothetical protein
MYRYFTHGNALVQLELKEEYPWRTNWLAERQGRPVRSPYSGIDKVLNIVAEKVKMWFWSVLPNVVLESKYGRRGSADWLDQYLTGS